MLGIILLAVLAAAGLLMIAPIFGAAARAGDGAAAGPERLGTSPALHALTVLGAIALAVALALRGGSVPQLPTPSLGGSGGSVAAERTYAKLPLSFEENRGQQNPRVDYLARTDAGAFFLTEWGARMVPSAAWAEPIDLRLQRAAPAQPRAIHELPGKINYLVGDDPSRWQRDVPTFARVRYRDAYPGIDLEWYGNRRRLEYDFRIAPGADPGGIALRIGGADSLRIDRDGDLLIEAASKTLRQRAPVAYQPTPRGRELVRASYVLHGRSLGFDLGQYDRSRPLVIDPLVLVYSTYLGGSRGDRADAIAADRAGRVYVAGRTVSTNFNTVAPIERDRDGGGFHHGDAFVAKLTRSGRRLVYSTYLGGNNEDRANGIAVDSSGSVYVAGSTASTNFNTVRPIERDADGDRRDAFVSKLTPSGRALAYSTYLGGKNLDDANAIAVDSAKAAYVAGDTQSTNFNTVRPIESDADGYRKDVFVSKLTPSGQRLVYSTYLGGSDSDSAEGIAVDRGGRAYITGETYSTDFDTVAPIEGDEGDEGRDAFVSKLTGSGEGLAYSTYLGGDSDDFAAGIAVDGRGRAYVTGTTASTDFNTVRPIERDQGVDPGDAFVSKLTRSGDGLAYSTYLGGLGVPGAGADFGEGIAVDRAGRAYVTGYTSSNDFKLKRPIERKLRREDAFFSQLTGSGKLAYSTYLGGKNYDRGTAIALGGAGRAFIAGTTLSSDLGTVRPSRRSRSYDAFVSELRVVRRHR